MRRSENCGAIAYGAESNIQDGEKPTELGLAIAQGGGLEFGCGQTVAIAFRGGRTQVIRAEPGTDLQTILGGSGDLEIEEGNTLLDSSSQAISLVEPGTQSMDFEKMHGARPAPAPIHGI